MAKAKKVVSLSKKCIEFGITYVVAVIITMFLRIFVYSFFATIFNPTIAPDEIVIPFYVLFLIILIVPLCAILVVMRRCFGPKAKKVVSKDDMPKLKTAVRKAFIITYAIYFILDYAPYLFIDLEVIAHLATPIEILLLALASVLSAVVTYFIISHKLNKYYPECQMNM